MLDIVQFIEERGGDPEAIRKSQKARGDSVEIVDEIISEYKDWVKIRFELDELNKQQNKVQKEIGLKFKKKEDPKELLQKKEEIVKAKEQLNLKEQEADRNLRFKVNQVGNIVHESVPISDNEDNNELVRDWAPEGTNIKEVTNIATATGAPAKLSHHEVLLRLDGYDPERGVKIVGHRGYFLRNYGVFLNQALINYGLSYLAQKGYLPLQAPVMMNKDVMAKTAQLSQFDEELYKVTDGDDEKYLIATSEQPISAYHSNEWFEKPQEQLPIRYAGFSSCFRREAGSHGKDAWGIFRVHAFEKIEQFCLTEPDKSWEEFDRMIGAAEGFYQSLGLPYRVVGIVSGELNNAAAKKYDLEAWFPFQKEFKELVSCSNCTDYQSRNLEIRCGIKSVTQKEKKYVHCLNSTLCATERALCCVLENYQTEDGLKVPEVLRKYIPGEPEFIPFVKELPKNSTSQKKK
ncbi:Serine--tRNA ligase, cytoplasmic [Komagataella phaffii CBS 7435]|uniref:serine--tRNA ligase n=2 Tax=Komagataella phaffii TaxID=460519 RepID=C4QYJ2_KOMPG|nr:Cytosolic seryl-tRNA synthetase, class II aminoacyl-tRNA synthetase [Komagataella phaffii GS115]AOA61798.1 GQ67_01692T0 [Komagataella phaffii]CAH2447139.1 Serine--tRNA ligase, cytoplasmic [Komagataella phaffii CBS 7435]AOA66108.1 GQ68_01707T0 [Komagataella phaffii GS115]CAY68315.1 Cytosolic seryl-tRNA synthetase, class II aminoacyl-tRNA synthetase [Komagataella phaffii GS115]CCA37384.1 Serine--tRNA ligase, cytoplasmic [Komagataella phaffii CBS 7435]